MTARKGSVVLEILCMGLGTAPVSRVCNIGRYAVTGFLALW